MAGLYIFRKRLYSWIIILLLVIFSVVKFDIKISYAVRCINILRSMMPRNYTNPKNCIKCHESIYRSWVKSRHALSWTSRTYIKASENRSKQKCLPCHVPREMTIGSKPEPRIDFRHDGIYCIPCHMTRHEMDMPPDIYTAPDPIDKERSYQKPEFCGSCHRKTFEEWKSTGITKKCQFCHMRSARKPSDHRFPFLRISEDYLDIEAKLIDKKIIISLMNRSIPHLFPTADNGDPRAYLYVRLYDKNGEEVDKYKEIFAPQQDTALQFGERITYEYECTDEVDHAEVTLQYKPSWAVNKRIIRRVKLLGAA